MHGHSDEVVIVVPAADSMKSDPLLVAGLPEHHSVCIETEDVIDPNSPKTVTESSSKFLSPPSQRKEDKKKCKYGRHQSEHLRLCEMATSKRNFHSLFSLLYFVLNRSKE